VKPGNKKIVEMENTNEFFRELYENFNNRKIDLVISQMTKNVRWANGMDGGYVYGHDGVKDYWEKQFETVSSNVTPLQIQVENNLITIKVHQVVHDLHGGLLADEYVYHYFHLSGDKIADFTIGEK
jgi:hypothetical protein